ncbi:MAG: hypothetical protein EOO05_12075 [Chitinophagaceae bacterium]|nr:MAG: hypothetical protein EOO05_12075 [Chitinophagaceae bacterium]
MDQQFTSTVQEYQAGSVSLKLCMPDAAEVRDLYRQQPGLGKPYWTAVWPSAEALCLFIEEHRHMFEDREVWELGAGLGLPSLLVSRYARKVFASDLYQPAVELVEQSARMNHIHNLQAAQIDWNHLPPVTADIVMLADINYDPLAFEGVSTMITSLLRAGSVVLLATPCRISSSAFIRFIRPFIKASKEYTVDGKPVLVFTLHGSDNIIQDHGAENDLQ